MDIKYRVRFATALAVFGAVAAVMVPVLITMDIQATVIPLYAIVAALAVSAITLVCLLQSAKR